MSFNKPKPDPVLEKLALADWKQFLVATIKKDDKKLEQSIGNTVARFERLVPNIKKSSKLLILSDGSSYLPVYLGSRFGCKITVICRTEEAANRINKSIKKHELEKTVGAEMKDFTLTQFDYDYFDMVWSTGMFYGEENLLSFLREMNRILVPQGRFVLCELASEDEDIQEKLGMYSFSEVLNLANRADLEKVYLRELEKETLAHYKYLDEILEKSEKAINKAHGKGGYDTAKSEIKNLIKLAKKGDISWGFMQLQKRNA